MNLDKIMETLAEVEDRAEFDRLWAHLGEIVLVVTKRHVAQREADRIAASIRVSEERPDDH